MIRYLLICHCFGIFVFLQNAKAEICQKAEGANDLLECLMKKHPELDLAELNVEVAKGQVKQSSQRPNPQIQWQGTDTQGGGGLTNEFNLQHTIELGSKQFARVKLAESELAIQKVGVEGSFGQIKIDLIVKLYRLRQINHEIEVIMENRHTFQRMISQYKRIGKMNPEQEISVNVFRMASEEVQLKLGELRNEKDRILTDLSVVSGEDLTPRVNQLPEIAHEWPVLENGDLEGPIVKQAKVGLNKANKLYEMEKAESWPNINVGPRLVQVPGSQGGTFLGAAISVPLPLLSLNKGGRAAALANKKRQEYRSHLVERKVKAEALRLIQTYKRSSEAYKAARKTSNIQNKHTSLHNMINRGVVTPSIVIELHRQIIEFYKSLHSQELAAVRARWEYYFLLGNINTKKIEGSRNDSKIH